MELLNTFSIAQPVNHAWDVIMDVERVAQCLPGAALLSIEGDDYHGAVKVKVGPVTAQYEGVARFTERDDRTHHAVLRAEGRDVHGQGTAAATVDLVLAPQGPGTQVTIGTNLELAGRVAQFGRGVIADVSGKLIGQFAARLEQEMAGTVAPATAPSPAAPQESAPSVRRRGIDEVEPLNLLSAAGYPALRQALPVVTGVLGVLAGWLLRSSYRRRPGRVASRTPADAQLVLNLVLPRDSASGEGN